MTELIKVLDDMNSGLYERTMVTANVQKGISDHKTATSMLHKDSKELVLFG